MSKSSNPIVAQERQPRQSERLSKRRSPQDHCQLGLFDPQPAESLLPLRNEKPQISIISGVSVKDANKYQVKLGNQVLGSKLSLDEALALAKRGVK